MAYVFKVNPEDENQFTVTTSDPGGKGGGGGNADDMFSDATFFDADSAELVEMELDGEEAEALPPELPAESDVADALEQRAEVPEDDEDHAH